MEAYGDGLEHDNPHLSEAEHRMKEIAQMARGCTVLILNEAARSGFVTTRNGTWDVSPGIKELAKFLNTEAKALQALGLERPAKPAPKLMDLLPKEGDRDSTQEDLD